MAVYIGSKKVGRDKLNAHEQRIYDRSIGKTATYTVNKASKTNAITKTTPEAQKVLKDIPSGKAYSQKTGKQINPIYGKKQLAQISQIQNESGAVRS